LVCGVANWDVDVASCVVEYLIFYCGGVVCLSETQPKRVGGEVGSSIDEKGQF
jgi:hypothetical protein